MTLERITIDVLGMRVFHYWRNDDGEQTYTVHSPPNFETVAMVGEPTDLAPKKKVSKAPVLDTEGIEVVHQYVNEHIGQKTLTDKAKHHINARLKTYTEQQLKEAIDRFSNNKWRMDNNADKPLSWFFRSDEQIETFLCLKTDEPEEQVATKPTGRWTK